MCLVLFSVLYWHIFICNFWVKGADTVVDPTIVQHANYKELAIDPTSRGDVSIRESVHPIVKRYAQTVESNNNVDTENNSKIDNPKKPLDASEILILTPVCENSVNWSEYESTTKQPTTESPNEPITETELINPASVGENLVHDLDYKGIAVKLTTESTSEPANNTNVVNPATIDEESVTESEDKATKKEPDMESPPEPVTNATPVNVFTVDGSDYEDIVTKKSTEEAVKEITSSPITAKPTRSKEELCLTQKQSLLEFGKSYGKRLKTWLSDMGRIHLSNENCTYQRAKLVGKFKVERGYININNNTVFQPSRFRYHKLQKLPMRAVKGVEVVFQYLVPSIDIHYNYSQEAFWKRITGTFDVVLTNQLVVISMIATKNDVGKCSAEDRALDITFNVRDIKVRFKVNGGGFMSQGVVSYVGEKVINTYIIKRLLPLKVKRAMLGKLEEIRLASKRYNAYEFYKEMDSALCNGIDLDCV